VGIDLSDLATDETIFRVNFWHWRTIVEAIRALHVIDADRAAALHEPFVSELTREEARTVAAAIRERLLPTLREDERLLLDGTRTTQPDDFTFHRDPAEQHENYSTNRAVLEQFVVACEKCAGFRVG